MCALCLLTACHKDEPSPFKPVEERTVLLLTNSGQIYNQDYEQVMKLPYCTFASQIISDGDDYFVSGTYEKGDKDRVGYWKNGKWNTLHVDFIDDVNHWIYGIGKWDYYIYLFDYPNLLRNSGIFPLEDGEHFAPAEQALAVTEGKCYVVGSIQMDDEGFIFMPVLYSEHKGKYLAERLPVPEGTVSGDCNSVYAYDKVHTLIGGSIDDRPVLWHDKQLIILPLKYSHESNIYYGEVKSVTVSNGHIYAVGNEANEQGDKVATMWCDNEVTQLVQDTETTSVAVEVMSYENDVYVITLEFTTNDAGEAVTNTLLWMNGKLIKVFPGLETKSFTVL